MSRVQPSHDAPGLVYQSEADLWPPVDQTEAGGCRAGVRVSHFSGHLY